MASRPIVIGCDPQLEYLDPLSEASVALVHRLILMTNNSTRGRIPDLVVNGGEKPWRLAGSGGRLNRAAPKCSVVDFVSRRKAVIMAGFWVKDLEGDK